MKIIIPDPCNKKYLKNLSVRFNIQICELFEAKIIYHMDEYVFPGFLNSVFPNQTQNLSLNHGFILLKDQRSNIFERIHCLNGQWTSNIKYSQCY